MAYLALNDYTLRISIENLNEILAQAIQSTGLTTDNVRNNAESWAASVIKSYLRAKYEIDGELSKPSSDTSRDFQMMGLMIDLSLCTLHKTINPRDIPEMRAEACEEAMEVLEKMRDGIILVNIPEKSDAVGGAYAASQPKFISKPYSDLLIFDDPSNYPNYPYYGNNP